IEVENWTVNMIETGGNTLTGGRLLRMRRWLCKETFMLTYGDGVSNVDLTALLDFHKRTGKVATVTAVRPPARFGGLTIEDGVVTCFTEKAVKGE
ncbi:glucose-1-phosphate cytidylyltransferase, partial [Acinetobacter baumannii]